MSLTETCLQQLSSLADGPAPKGVLRDNAEAIVAGYLAEASAEEREELEQNLRAQHAKLSASIVPTSQLDLLNRRLAVIGGALRAIAG